MVNVEAVSINPVLVAPAFTKTKPLDGAFLISEFANAKKTCTRCHQDKDAESFRLVPRYKNGIDSRCRMCRQELSREYSKKHRVGLAVKAKVYRAIEATRLRRNARVRIRRLDHLAEEKAYAAVRRAVHKGELEKLPCGACGNVKVQAHHDDYSKQLEVRWLCFEHHLAVHGKTPVEPSGPHAAETRPLGSPLRDDA